MYKAKRRKSSTIWEYSLYLIKKSKTDPELYLQGKIFMSRKFIWDKEIKFKRSLITHNWLYNISCYRQCKFLLFPEKHYIIQCSKIYGFKINSVSFSCM